MMKVELHRVTVSLFLLYFLMLTLAVAVTRATAGPMVTEAIGATTRVSVDSDGIQGNDSSWSPSISADGRYVAFSSLASNLVPGDTNAVRDVFVHDRETEQTTRVSVASDGSEGNGWSQSPTISADGRYVAFVSGAGNLAPGDTNDEGDVFVHDQVTGETTRVSVAWDGTESNDRSWSPSISGDGRYVAFGSNASNLVPGDTNAADDVFVHDRTTAETTRISVASDRTEGNAGSYFPTISEDGRYVAFSSLASNLVPGDTNEICGWESEPENCQDVFLHDRTTGETTRVSVASDGTEGNGWSGSPSISAGGRYVAFDSGASNLVPGDTNDERDVLVHDRTTGETSRISVASDGTEGNIWSASPSISSDGRYVAYSSRAGNLVPADTNFAVDVLVHDRTTGETNRVSVASGGRESNYDSYYPSISGGGRYVAFASRATTLVMEDTNRSQDVFVRDRTPEYGVAFSGYATRIGAPGVVVTHSVMLHNVGTQPDSYDLALSGGSWPAAINGPTSVHLADGASSAVAVVVSVPADAQAGDNDSDAVMLSATSQGSPGLSDTADLTTAVGGGATARVTVASDGTESNNWSGSPSISGDGRFVAFYSWASNLVPADTNFADDVFVHDRTTGETSRISVASDGTEGNYSSGSPGISADGRYVAFDSDASNLVPGDTNDEGDVFVHDRTTGETTRVSVASDGSEGNGWSYSPSISADGRYVAFGSQASNLVPGDTNDISDAFVHDRVTGETMLVSVASDGTQGDDDSGSTGISADGRHVAFSSTASNLVPGEPGPGLFVHDRMTRETVRISVTSEGAPGISWSSTASFSGSFRYVAFESWASNLVPGDTNGEEDIFVHDRETGETTRVSVASGGIESNDRSWSPRISADGRYVVFESLASNLVAGDTNDARDVFVHDRITGETTRVSVSGEGTEGNGLSFSPTVSSSGRYVAFASWASNLAPGDTNEIADVFVHDRYFGYLPSYLPFISRP